jgi:heavy metal efflux system protein
VPLLTFSGVEGRMFEPMALTVIIALAAAFVLSITLVPALIAIAATSPRWWRTRRRASRSA